MAPTGLTPKRTIIDSNYQPILPYKLGFSLVDCDDDEEEDDDEDNNEEEIGEKGVIGGLEYTVSYKQATCSDDTVRS